MRAGAHVPAPRRGALDASSHEDARALLQRRVAGFALAVGGVNLAALVLRVLTVVLGRAQLPFVSVHSAWLHAGATVSLLAIWALTRSGRRSERFVRAVEALGLLGAAVLIELFALTLTTTITSGGAVRELAADEQHHALLLLALVAPLVGASFVLTYALVMRAAFVPTSARHTAILTAIVGAPLVVVGYQAGLGTASLELGGLDAPVLAIGGAVQWAVTVVVCATISKVIYGLREEVQEARRLGQYTLEELIGEGGMGAVYRASHAMLRRPTAIKLLSQAASPDAASRFEREVQLTAQLTHPNTVTIFDYGRTADGVVYYAMELLDGATLEDVVEVDGPQPPARVAHVLAQVAGALGEAHSIGLIHRDVKPANIVLCRQGGELDVAKVVDFGLVKELEERHPAAVSQEGTISGTPLYMAPEILTEPNAASPRSDIYALGAVGYYLLTGEHVFGGRTVIEVLGHHLHSEPLPPSRRLGDPVPEDLERLVLECLHKDPRQRPQDAAELRARLEACEGLGRWTQRSAEKWWTVHGPALEAKRHEHAAPEAARKVAVDLVSRSLPEEAREAAHHRPR